VEGLTLNEIQRESCRPTPIGQQKRGADSARFDVVIDRRPSAERNVVMMSPNADISAARADADVVLRVRCGGGDGRCGKVQAVIREGMVVDRFWRRCHRFPWWLLERDEVIDAFQVAAAARERAQRAGRRFTPHSITIRPLPHQLREDRETIMEREWRVFEAYRDSHPEEFENDDVSR
jgi:hypothetical protein